MRALALLVLLSLGACGQAAYPPEYRLAFVQSCQTSGSTEAHCDCVFDRVEREVPRAEFEAADAAMNSGQTHPLTARILEFSEQCRTAAPS